MRSNVQPIGLKQTSLENISVQLIKIFTSPEYLAKLLSQLLLEESTFPEVRKHAGLILIENDN